MFLPQTRSGLTAAKNWGPLNLINCKGKLGEKGVADQVKDFGREVFYGLQYGLFRGRMMVDMLYRSVRRPHSCINGGVVWGGDCGM